MKNNVMTKLETEKELRISPDLRQIRLDVISIDREHRLYYTEMQQRDTGNLRKRSRYYQAQLDASLLEPGRRCCPNLHQHHWEKQTGFLTGIS